jgi:dihydroorotate dehydrogenase electron transfer subunit
MTEPATTSRKQFTAEIVDNIDLTPTHPGHFRMILKSPWLVESAQPGQFVHILPPMVDGMLRRPFSIESINSSEKRVTILYRMVGDGTRLMACASPGTNLDIIGPLGNGFPIDPKQPAVLVGGGVGIPPLVYLAHVLDNPQVFLGAKNLTELVCVEDFQFMNIIPVIATEDGSAGFEGLITEAMEEHDQFDKGTVVYSCGPVPMLAEVARWSKSHDFRCWASLENKLGCGIGACLGCSIPIREEGGDVHYERVCYDGPVFDGLKVAFDLM